MTYAILLFFSITDFSMGKSLFKSSTRTADKFYVYRTLEKVFGESNKSILVKNILNSPELFGGGCLPYNVSMKSEKFDLSDENFEDRCFNNITEIGSPAFVEMSVIRQVKTENTCNEILKDTKNIRHALALVSLSESSPIDLKSVKRTTNLFFYKKKQRETYSKIIVNNQIKTWRDVLLVLCKSPEWQIL
ncbi:hypothetical protein A9Q84_19185 [Halobacteriovorax marinus]|uniref:Uncharacterized protein n=1 Tax=Halobacteriovorax marinus TaxID=97084 RepID=A0A1Y5F2G1_9BACT|nr:hypothetical protein A9Q84_19185 [Halobacteriovorax marinus]